MLIMDDDSDEYEFAKCNIALLKETIRELRASDTPHANWPLLPGLRDEWELCAETEDSTSPTASARKRALSSSSGTNVKRARRLSAPSSDPEDSAGSDVASEADLPGSPAAPPALDTPAVARVPSDPPPPCSSELTVTAAPAGGGSTGAADGPVAAVDVAALESQQLTDASHLRLEPNLVLVAADAALDAPTAARWLQHTLTPKLLSGEMPSAELVSALVGLSGRHPEQIIEHCLLPLTAGELLTCDDLATRLVTEGLQETHRTQLVRRLCGRPLSPAAVSLLLSLLPVCPPSADLATTLTDRLESSAAEEQHRSSAAFARLLLLTVQRTGHLLDAGERARLAAAAERGRTALRRAVQAALRKLE